MSERDEVREARTLSLADEIRYRMRHETRCASQRGDGLGESLPCDCRVLELCNQVALLSRPAPVAVTEAMVHVASVALADEDGNHEWEALSDKTQHNYYATLRRVLTAALAARGED